MDQNPKSETTEANVRTEPDLTDIGTRYEHLKDYADALEACVDIVESRGLTSQSDKQRYIELSIAAKVIKHTIDTFAGYGDVRTEYLLYKLLHSVPVKAEEIEGGRGTPLENRGTDQNCA